MYPNSIKNIIECFKDLPGIGEKTAERLAFSLINFDKEINKLGFGINKGDDRYKHGLTLCEWIQPVYDKLLSKENKEFFAHNGVETTYLLNVSNAFGVRSFVPKTESRTNKRLEYFTRVLKAKGLNFTSTILYHFFPFFIITIYDTYLTLSKEKAFKI